MKKACKFASKSGKFHLKNAIQNRKRFLNLYFASKNTYLRKKIFQHSKSETTKAKNSSHSNLINVNLRKVNVSREIRRLPWKESFLLTLNQFSMFLKTWKKRPVLTKLFRFFKSMYNSSPLAQLLQPI